MLSGAGHPYTRLLISAVPEHRPGMSRRRARIVADAAEPDDQGCRYRPRCPAARDICATTAPPALTLGDGHRASCHFAADIQTKGLPG